MAEQVTAGSESNLKPVAKRAIAYAYAYVYANALANANALAKAVVYANALANFIAKALAYTIANANDIALAYTIANANDIALAIVDANVNARELEELKILKDINFTVLIARLEALKAQVSDDNQPLDVHRAFASRILQTWLNAFNLSRELVELSSEEAEAWKNYLYANWLIVQCKAAAVRVSPKTWEAIEERMLLVPNN